MARRKVGEENIRKIQKSKRSYYVTLPIELVRKFGWREGQKVVVRDARLRAPRGQAHGNKLEITDWKD